MTPGPSTSWTSCRAPRLRDDRDRPRSGTATGSPNDGRLRTGEPLERLASARRGNDAVLHLCALSAALNDHRGSLGSDTGGKIAALERMHTSDDLSPDLGYWAEHDDPDGSLYPIFFSGRGDAGWITTSTLPMLYAAYPLYALGGMQAALIIPMLAAVAAALAARALATRLGGPPWATFWLVGVATPLAVYALDFWEHAVGVAAMMWAIVLLDDVVHGRAGWRAAGGAGALFGLAATMRTEAFVYAAVAAVVVGVVICRRRSLRDLVKLAMAGALGGVVVLGANAALERVVLGSSIRTGVPPRRQVSPVATARNGCVPRVRLFSG